jgi:hypothetical protein
MCPIFNYRCIIAFANKIVKDKSGSVRRWTVENGNRIRFASFMELNISQQVSFSLIWNNCLVFNGSKNRTILFV